MNVFHKDNRGKLHCIHSSSETIEASRQDVLEYLFETNEIYYLPVLVEVKGGKT